MFTWENVGFIYIFGICDTCEMQHDSNTYEHWLLLDNSMCMCEMLSGVYELL